MAGVIAVAALWLLARIRFPDRPVTPNPVPPVLSQIASTPKYDELAAEIARVYVRVQTSLRAIDVPSLAPYPTSSWRRTAFSFRGDLAVTWLPSASDSRWRTDPSVVAIDAASGLAVARVSTAAPGPPALWTPHQLQQPRYFVATELSSGSVSLRPVFVGSLETVDTALWPDPVWVAPADAGVTAGTFLFTSGAEFAGLVIMFDGRPVIVPGSTVLAEAERLVTAASRPAGTLGIEVQNLTPAIAAATGAKTGVVVTFADADVAAQAQLAPGDVIEDLDGVPLTTRSQWEVRVARLFAGEKLTIAVRHRGERRDVQLMAGPVELEATNRSLGLTLRAATTGSEIIRIARGSAAERAGLVSGDIITSIGGTTAPTPAQVQRAYASLGQGQGVVVAVSRGTAHFVTTFEG